MYQFEIISGKYYHIMVYLKIWKLKICVCQVWSEDINDVLDVMNSYRGKRRTRHDQTV